MPLYPHGPKVTVLSWVESKEQTKNKERTNQNQNQTKQQQTNKQRENQPFPRRKPKQTKQNKQASKQAKKTGSGDENLLQHGHFLSPGFLWASSPIRAHIVSVFHMLSRTPSASTPTTSWHWLHYAIDLLRLTPHIPFPGIHQQPQACLDNHEKAWTLEDNLLARASHSFTPHMGKKYAPRTQ